MEEPIIWPVVKIDGMEIPVEYSMGLLYRASAAGVNLADLGNAAKNFATMLDLFAVIAKPFLEAEKRQILNGEQWASKLTDTGQFVEVAVAIRKAHALSVKTKPVEETPLPQATATAGLPN